MQVFVFTKPWPGLEAQSQEWLWHRSQQQPPAPHPAPPSPAEAPDNEKVTQQKGALGWFLRARPQVLEPQRIPSR